MMILAQHRRWLILNALSQGFARHARIILMAACLMTMVTEGFAQCTFRNTAVAQSENLNYNLYFNWQMVWLKAGTATWKVDRTKYKETNAIRASIITRGNKRADRFFLMRDTLLCFTSDDLAPLYFRKGAREGKRYNVDEVFYSYPNGQCAVRLHRQRTNGSHEWKQEKPGECVFDMLSLFVRARSFNPVAWKKGHTVTVGVADGRNTTKGKLIYNGKDNVKADNGKKYQCLELTYKELSDGKWKEIARFFVTDDNRHIPVRIDLKLRFGSAKAYLVSNT